MRRLVTIFVLSFSVPNFFSPHMALAESNPTASPVKEVRKGKVYELGSDHSIPLFDYTETTTQNGDTVVTQTQFTEVKGGTLAVTEEIRLVDREA